MINMKILFLIFLTINYLSLYSQVENERFSQSAVDYSNLADSSIFKSFLWDSNTKEAFGVFKNGIILYVKGKVAENLELTIKFIVNDPSHDISETHKAAWKNQLINLCRPFLNEIDIDLINKSTFYFDNENNEFSIFPKSTNYTFFEIYGIQPNMQTALIEIHILKSL